MSRIPAILRKEYRELRALPSVVWTSALMPLLFVALPLAALASMAYLPMEEISDMESGMRALARDPVVARLSAREQAQIALGRPISLLLLVLPVMIPSIVASFSIVGEKTGGTLEPLLATPVRTWELLVAKILAALLPAIALTWLAAIAYAVGAWFIALSEPVFGQLVNVTWAVLVMVCAPLLALVAVAVTTLVSSRAKDPRTAQQAAGFLVLPVVAMIPLQLSGLVLLEPGLVYIVVAALLLLSAASVFVAVKLFDRESILTRWR